MELQRVSFELDCEVLPKQTKENVHMFTRGGKAFMGRKTPDEVFANALEILLKCQQFRPEVPLRGPVKAWIVIYIPFPKKRPDGCPQDATIWPKCTRPDCDNLSKQLLDVLESAGFFEVGDGQVFKLEVDKYWIRQERPSVFIELQESDGTVIGCPHAKERQLQWLKESVA